MKPSEFKKVLKPLIKQTVKEVLLEEGVLSKIVAEVARGLQAPMIVESPKKRKVDHQDSKNKKEQYETNRQERIRRLNESVAVGVDVFSGVQKLPDAPSSGGTSPMAHVASDDHGVDISDIQNLVGNKWRDLI
tara:strand:+ start:11387 stop:11785 length:399 start_codon:yes stop_codon:yes gene_type:complete